MGVPVDDAILLADATVLDGPAWESLSQDGRDAAYALYQAGHYGLLADDPDEDGGDGGDGDA